MTLELCKRDLGTRISFILPDTFTSLKPIFPISPKEYFTRVTVTLKEGESLVQQGFEFVGKDESGCLWRKSKSYEDIVKERELSENS